MVKRFDVGRRHTRTYREMCAVSDAPEASMAGPLLALFCSAPILVHSTARASLVVPGRPAHPSAVVVSQASERPRTVASLPVRHSRASDLPRGMGERWDRFTMVVWPYKTPPPGPLASQLYASVNLHAVELDGQFSNEVLQFANVHHYPFLVGHAAGKGDLFLYPKAWTAFEKSYRADRRMPVRPVSLWDPTTIARMKKNLTESITRARSGKALGYGFDDEISITSYTDPADVDWSPEGLARFRSWLRLKYGPIGKLNQEWNRHYTNWDEVMPTGVDDLRPSYDQPMDRWNLASWADHREFMDWSWASLLANLTRTANGLDPTTPAGFEGGQAPSTYGGYDYARLTRSVQYMEAYDIGSSDAILRSFWGSRHPHVQTYFLSGNPALDRWFLWYYLVQGDRGVICWPDTQDGPWFPAGHVTPYVRSLADTFREVQGSLSQIFTNARFDDDGIGVYYSQPSIRTSWFMDIQTHGSSWPNRLSALNNENASDILNRLAWTKLLDDCGFQYRFISYLDVQDRGIAAMKGCRVLILPRTLALSDNEANTIRSFVRRGGTVVADYLPGVFDEHGKARTHGALDSLFGVQRSPGAGVLNGNTVAEVNAERYQLPLPQRLSYDGAITDPEGFVLYERGLGSASPTRTTALLRPAGDRSASVSSRQVEGVSEEIRNPSGRGLAYYGNWTTLPYLYLRSQAEGTRYRRRLKGALQVTAGGRIEPLTPRVEVLVNGKSQPLCQRLFWSKDGRGYLCLVMNPVRSAQISGMGAATDAPLGPIVPITLLFRSPMPALKNERTGKILRKGRLIHDFWKTDEANIYSWTP